MNWVDVSTPIFSGMPNYPGDPRVVVEQSVDRDCSVTSLAMSAHTGTHMDAPLHFIPGAPSIDQIPADVCMGVAQVISLTGELPNVTAERVLFQTTPDHPVLTTAQAQHLVQHGVRLVGVTALSVDAVGGAEFPVHHVLLGANMWIVEGLDLSAVDPGEYDLICLPLRIRGADGAPARALLRKR